MEHSDVNTTHQPRPTALPCRITQPSARTTRRPKAPKRRCGIVELLRRRPELGLPDLATLERLSEQEASP